MTVKVRKSLLEVELSFLRQRRDVWVQRKKHWSTDRAKFLSQRKEGKLR